MNIVLFLNKDFEANLAYVLLKEKLLEHRVKIFYSESVGKKKTKPVALLEIEHFEKEFFYKDLQEIITQNNINPDFEFFGPTFSSFELLKCENVNAPDFIKEMKLYQADLFISIRFAQIFRNDIIAVPKRGVLNLHSAVLPDYKGIMGTLHNLKDQKHEYGCTLHYINNSDIDTGDIISIAKRPVETKKSLLWHIIKLYPMGVKLILDAIDQLSKFDKIPSNKQDMSKGAYFSVPTNEHFQKLKDCGIVPFSLEDYKELLAEYISEEFKLKGFRIKTIKIRKSREK